MKRPKIEGYYFTKTIENKWGVCYWDGIKFWDDPNQDGKLSFGIKDDWITEFIYIPDAEQQAKQIKELTEGAIKASEIKVADEQQIKELKDKLRVMEFDTDTEISVLEQQIKELMKEYTYHKLDCDLYLPYPENQIKPDCTCGYDKLKQALK